MNTEHKKKIVAFDLLNRMHIYAHVYRDLKHNSKHTGAMFGILREVSTIIDRMPNAEIIFCEDTPKGDNYRREIYSGYKAKRKKKSEEESKRLKDALDLFSMFIEYVSMGHINCNGYEADDIIAQLKSDREYDKLYIVSNDSDLDQLLNQKVFRIKTLDEPYIKPDDVARIYGGTGKYVIMFHAMTGGHNDVLPMTGIGPVTAKKIITELRENGSSRTYKEKIAAVEVLEKHFHKNMLLLSLPFIHGMDTVDTNYCKKHIQYSKDDILEYLLSTLNIGRNTAEKYATQLYDYNEKFSIT